MNKESTVSRARQGFTLIELLALVGIIAILAAILFPVFAQAKTAASTASTLTSLQQVGRAANLYSNDYDQGVVLTTQGGNAAYQAPSWVLFLQPYAKSKAVFFDPSRPYVDRQTVTIQPGNVQPWFLTTTFAINDRGYSGYDTDTGGQCGAKQPGGKGYVWGGRSVPTMEMPERRIAFAPNTYGNTSYGFHFFKSFQASWFDPKTPRTQWSWDNQVYGTRDLYSNRSIPVVHADGSAGSLKPRDFLSKGVTTKVADWCKWMNAGARNTWGAYWTPS